MDLAFIYIIKRVFQKHFDEINMMGKAYPKIERFYIYNTGAILFLAALVNGVYWLFYGWDGAMPGVFNLFLLFVLIIQLSFLIMIFRITWLRDHLQSAVAENESLAAYSSSLERNMDDIRNIKHDIKNIFLTMGNFVDQSGNEEMRAYYRDKIYPFAHGEIAKSDLYGKLLSAINNEQLKAFLFYKISQAVERGVEVSLETPPRFTNSGEAFEFIDLIRILGILLDNAIEECMESPASSILTLP